MERYLYHFKATNEDVQNSYEDVTCFKSYHVLRTSWIPKNNLHMLWMVIVLHLSYKMPMGQTWVVLQAITNTLLLVVK